MRAAVTISCAITRNNRPSVRRWTLSVSTAILSIAAFSCTANTPAPIEIPTWELARAEPIKPILLGQSRVSFDRPLPNHLVQKLSPEFSLITITKSADWVDARRRLHLQPVPPLVDLTRGMIVGILADVGEYAQGDWPIQITQVRTVSGMGWVEASFAAGLYFPLKTAGYLQLAYVPDLRAVSMVRINHRTFAITPPSPAK